MYEECKVYQWKRSSSLKTRLVFPPSLIGDGLIALRSAPSAISRYLDTEQKKFADFTQTLHKHLVIRFEDLPGLEMVKQKQYILHDAQSGQQLRPSAHQNHFLRPGQRVTMSMCFADVVRGESFCPGCTQESVALTHSTSTWSVSVSWQ